MKRIFLLLLFAALYFCGNAQKTPQISPVFSVMLSAAGFNHNDFAGPDTIKYTTPLQFCQGGSVLLTADGASGGDAIQWKLNGTAIPGANGISYLANASGSYSVTVTHNNNTLEYAAVTVAVYSNPTASFSFSPTNQCGTVPVVFANSSNGSGLVYQWTFDDLNSGSANSSSQTNPSHQFVGSFGNSTQTFQVQLIATSGDGCSDTISHTVTTKQLPDANIEDNFSTTPFTHCSGSLIGSVFNLTIDNASSTTATNTLYQINWGDNSTPFSSANLPATGTVHTYNTAGYFPLTLTVTGQNGCVNTKVYSVYNGSNPAVPFINPGASTGQCTPFAYVIPSIPINNPPGTIYIMSSNDGSPNDTLTSVPPSYTRVFKKSSCGATGGITANTFYINVRAQNPCGFSDMTISPITTNTKPKTKFSVQPDSVACVNSILTFTNISEAGVTVDNAGNCNTTNKINWLVSPGTGWNISSGSLGSATPNNNSSTWGTNVLGLTFTAAGEYMVSLISSSTSNVCGSDTFTKKICIQTSPTAAFTTNAIGGCGPFVVTTTNATNNLPSCGPISYNWSITKNAATCTGDSTQDVVFIGGSTQSSTSPEIRFNNPGTYSLKLSVITKCGTVTSTKTVTVTAPPKVSLPTISNVCGSATISPVGTVTNCGSVAPTYSWSFPGGIPASANTLNPGSIVYSSPGTYTVSFAVTNECGTTTATRTFTINPLPSITVPANQVFCPGENAGSFVLTASAGTVTWNSTLATIGLPGTSGTGNIPAFITTNSTATALTATITASATSGGCTGQSVFTIKVNPRPPVPTVAALSYCQGATAIPLTAGALAGNSINWYTVSSGGTASTTAPTPSTTTSGNTIYYASQVDGVTGCESNRVSLTVTVKPTPVIASFSSVDPSSCNTNTGSITLTGLTPGSYSVSYFKNGNPLSVILTAGATGNLTIPNLGSGIYTNFTVTLNGCPSNSVGPITLSDPNPPAQPTLSSNAPICAGNTLQLNSTTTATGTITYSWSGPGSFTSNVQNPVINNAGVGASGVYNLTTTVSGCSSSASISVTVNPKPPKPQVVRPVSYCINAVASPLQATAAAGNTLNWYTAFPLVNGTSVPITPSTATAGTFLFYVTQANSSACESDTAIIPVIVYPLIAGNTIDSSQTICSGSVPHFLFQVGSLTGGNGSYLYQWQSSVDGGATWNNIPSATGASYAPPALTATTLYRRVVSSGPCGTNLSNEITITVQGSISHYDISAAQTICAGSSPQLLSGELPIGGNSSFNYQWQSSLNNVAWTDIAGATAQDYQPPVLNATTYYRRKVSSGPCSGISNVIAITVNPIPVLNSLTNAFYCTGATAPATSFSASPSTNLSFAWTNDDIATGLAASGTGGLPSFTTTNSSLPKVPLVSNISVTPIITVNGVACNGVAGSFAVTVLPKLTLDPIPDTLLCTGSSIPSSVPAHDGNVVAGATVSYTWTRSGGGTTLASSGSGAQIPSYNTINTGNTDLVATITITPVYTLNSVSCSGVPRSYTVTVKPATAAASAGPDTALCNATNYTMLASAASGGSGSWTQIGTATANIVDPSQPHTQITNLQAPNTYVFVWTVAGFANCPATKDTVTIRVDPPILNEIDTTSVTRCAGQSVTISGQLPTGGTGLYLYQWQFSIDGITWSNLPLQTAQNISFVPSQTMFVRRVVSSLPCTSQSLSVHITVQAAIGNNSINADQGVCINTSASNISGSVPTGGNGIFQYQWQQSLDGGITWTDLVGAVSQNYSPGIMTATTKFRRLVVTSLCSGPQASISNIVTITVHPNAKAVFTASPDTACAPFNINGAVINLSQFPLQNSSYQWFADNNFIGSSTTFPGYVLTTPASSVVIKLVTLSPFGCLKDSISHTFYTRIVPVPSFSVSDTVGCGPLTVSITNTTPSISVFTYHWDFGNGQVSNAAQPGSIVFAPNPNSGDTTYTVKLSAISQCTTVDTTVSIRIKSKPKALFAPDISTGCSPMTVIFSNISKGIGNSYTWNFGDGSAPVNSSQTGTISHTFITGIQDTFYVKLIAVNECGKDSMTYAIVVHPNTVHLDFAINGNQQSGCTPHTVSFINNSQGASVFSWNFGDNTTLNTTLNIDTVTHTYLSPGTYVITLHASNGCSDTTSTETIIVYPNPVANFAAAPLPVCVGSPISFTNNSSGATSYLWTFGDLSSSTATNPVKTYSTPGTYTVKLTAFRFNPVGSVCSDTSVIQIQVVSGLPGWFTASDTIAACSPFTVNFSNQNVPANSAVWDFGDNTTGSGNNVSHTYQQAGTYLVHLTAVSPGGCTYNTTRTIKINGPSGSWNHTTGYLCNTAAANFQVQATNADSIIYHFGDGTHLSTVNTVAFHSYQNPGVYFPSVTLKNNAGCLVTLPGVDSIRVDRVKGGFTVAQQAFCGYTRVAFVDTTHAFFGTAQVSWNYGDGVTDNGTSVFHYYNTSGTYNVVMIIKGVSGCADTITRQVQVIVRSKPVAAIQGPLTACVGVSTNFISNIQSIDPVSLVKWTLSNGASSVTTPFAYTFSQPGNYTLQLVAGTVNGCFDTVSHTIQVNPSPSVSTIPDLVLCKGNSTVLATSSTGVVAFSWTPLQGLSCTSCASPTATPASTTNYIVRGDNVFGCSAYDTVLITVMQPFTMSVSPPDTICIGESTNLVASGGTQYSWSPAAGLSNTTVSNPTASPATTTVYRVIAFDGFNCFTDTAFVTVAVGQYPVVNLGPDQNLASGTLLPLASTVLNGPIANWAWTQSGDLSCSNCPLPIATVKKDVTYVVKVTNIYGCTDTDTLNIKAFCESSQVFIPNAFTPDGDGINDILMVRGKGIVMVKTFRIFNRWGEVVFEKDNFPPNNPAYGWNGTIRGNIGGPDVFVYTAEVICENGSSFTYKGNVSIIK